MSAVKEYTIMVFSENKAGLLARVVAVFTRRHINIESLTTSQSSIEGIHRFTIVVFMDEDMVQKLVAQLEKQIDVLKAFYYTTSEIVYQEIALYKVPTKAFLDNDRVERLVRTHNARILQIEAEFIVIEKTGHMEETEALLNDPVILHAQGAMPNRTICCGCQTIGETAVRFGDDQQAFAALICGYPQCLDSA